MSAQNDEGMDMTKEAGEAKMRQKRTNAHIGAAPTDGTAQKASALSDLRSLHAQTVRKLDVSGKGEAYLTSWGDLRESWYDERLERD